MCDIGRVPENRRLLLATARGMQVLADRLVEAIEGNLPGDWTSSEDATRFQWGKIEEYVSELRSLIEGI